MHTLIPAMHRGYVKLYWDYEEGTYDFTNELSQS